MYIEPQKKRRNFNNSIRYGKQNTYFFFFKLQVFIATQGVGTHHKNSSNNKLPVDHCINVRRIVFFVQRFFCGSVYVLFLQDLQIRM